MKGLYQCKDCKEVYLSSDVEKSKYCNGCGSDNIRTICRFHTRVDW